MADWFGKEVFKLGFGLMRLPKLEDGKTIDVDQVSKMVDMFIEAGGTYFDTAYVYDDGRSEEATKLALVDRYPREKYTLCTKLNAWHGAHDEESAKKQFYTSLERTGAGYFDYYLLHALMDDNAHLYDDYHLWDYVADLKEKGLIKYFGFSFHGSPKLLDKLLTDHPEVDFIQLQINYADWEDEKVAARECWEIARKHDKSITVMEPVKGGALANTIPEVKEIFEKANKNLSPAGWAIRYAASLDGILTVLSGMSNVEQMEDNLSFMRDFKPLNEDEQKVIKEVVKVLDSVETIKCTACHYCTEGCPSQIPIPEIFSARNRELMFNAKESAKMDYARVTEGKGKASDCIQCGQCENACPQHLPIISLLQEISGIME
ncbi:MAG: aldo/keto reductase [Lachnospiraceae bacterium]|nr:aldo/keto reductase [Lachnospiraceae bacterium]